jgi:hypothetical protein
MALKAGVRLIFDTSIRFRSYFGLNLKMIMKAIAGAGGNGIYQVKTIRVNYEG